MPLLIKLLLFFKTCNLVRNYTFKKRQLWCNQVVFKGLNVESILKNSCEKGLTKRRFLYIIGMEGKALEEW